MLDGLRNKSYMCAKTIQSIQHIFEMNHGEEVSYNF